MLSNKKPFGRIILIILIFLQAVNGLFGGISLVIDPTGNLIKMPLSSLEGTIFNSYLIPGIILFLLLGIMPLITFIGLIKRPDWRLFELLNIFKTHHWSWAYSIYTSIILILWIDFEILLIGYSHFIQSFCAFHGVAILIATLLPSVMKYYQREKFLTYEK